MEINVLWNNLFIVKMEHGTEQHVSLNNKEYVSLAQLGTDNSASLWLLELVLLVTLFKETLVSEQLTSIVLQVRTGMVKDVL